EALRERVVNAQGYGISMGQGTLSRTGSSGHVGTINGFAIEHDLNDGQAFGLTGDIGDRNFEFTLTAEGRYAETGGAVGFVAPRLARRHALGRPLDRVARRAADRRAVVTTRGGTPRSSPRRTT